MSTSMDKLAKVLKAQMTASDDRKPKPYDTQAEVLRVEDGIAWVHIPGGVDETPVRLTINANKGDMVNIHVANGSAWITGNGTNPPTDDTIAIAANGEANKAIKIGEKALDETVRAMSAAEMAETEAQRAGEAASIAGQAANQAVDTANYLDQAVYGTITYEYDNNGTIETVYKRDDGTYYYLNNGVEVTVAESDLERDSETGQLVTDREKDGLDTTVEQARASAESAKANAEIAQTSADTAIRQLDVVENIVGVLDLIATNGTYELTQDTEVVPNKWYFTQSGTAPNYVYTAVQNPSGDPSTQGWYELTSIDEAVKNYVSSHMVLDGNGLLLQADGSNARIRISTEVGNEGLILYGTDGNQIAKYGSNTVIGNAQGFHIDIGVWYKLTEDTAIDSGKTYYTRSGTSPNYTYTEVDNPTVEDIGTYYEKMPPELGFYQATRKVAYINNNQLYITQSVVLQQMDLGTPVNSGGLGQWSWKVHANGATPSRNNLNLKWIG